MSSASFTWTKGSRVQSQHGSIFSDYFASSEIIEVKICHRQTDKFFVTIFRVCRFFFKLNLLPPHLPHLLVDKLSLWNVTQKNSTWHGTKINKNSNFGALVKIYFGALILCSNQAPMQQCLSSMLLNLMARALQVKNLKNIFRFLAIFKKICWFLVWAKWENQLKGANIGESGSNSELEMRHL